MLLDKLKGPAPCRMTKKLSNPRAAVIVIFKDTKEKNTVNFVSLMTSKIEN